MIHVRSLLWVDIVQQIVTENSTIAINQSRKHMYMYLMSDLFFAYRSNSQTRYPYLQCQIQYLLFFICLGFFFCLFRLVCLFCSVNSLSKISRQNIMLLNINLRYDFLCFLCTSILRRIVFIPTAPRPKLKQRQ